MARPKKLTLSLQDEIVRLISQGASTEQAAESAGITPRSLYYWMAKGREGKPKEFLQFFQAIKKAQSDFELMHLRNIQRYAASGAWQASAWILERVNRERYGKVVAIENTDTNFKVEIVNVPRPIKPEAQKVIDV